MSASDYLENASLDKTFRNVNYTVTTVYVSLHSAYPEDTGLNEIAGGSYARQSSTWNAASGGSTDNNGDLDWTDLPAATLVAAGFWDALSGGNFLGYGWFGQGGDVPKPFTATDVAGNVFVSPGHGYANNDRVVFDDEISGSIPSGITIGTVYYVVGSTTDTFQVSATPGGAAVDYTAAGSGHVLRVSALSIAAGEGFRISSNNAILRLF